MIYIWLSRVELALSRVADRVRHGGHDVPSVVVERRYWRGLKNFFALYMPLADSWTLCDNSEEAPVMIAHGGKNVAIEVIDQTKFDSYMLSPFSPTSSALEAGRIMLRRIHQLAEQRISFGFETTLASRSYVSCLCRAQAAGYNVHVIFQCSFEYPDTLPYG